MLAVADYDAVLAAALDAAERSVALDPDDEYAQWNLGNVLIALRQHERGIAALERAVEINPNYSDAWGSLGTALIYAGQPREGIAKNEIALRSDPLREPRHHRCDGNRQLQP